MDTNMRYLCFMLIIAASLTVRAQNFNNTTPAAPVGSVNILWQYDTSTPRNISAYLAGPVNYAVLGTGGTGLGIKCLLDNGTWGTCGSGSVTSSGSPVSGNLAQFTTSTNIAPASYSQVVALFSGCSGTQYLGFDGNCHTSGSGATIPSTTNLIAGSGTGNGADSGIAPGNVVQSSQLSHQCTNVGIVDTATLGTPNTIGCIDGVTAGYVLTDNGPGNAPTYQPAASSGITSINGDTTHSQLLSGGSSISVNTVGGNTTIAYTGSGSTPIPCVALSSLGTLALDDVTDDAPALNTYIAAQHTAGNNVCLTIQPGQTMLWKTPVVLTHLQPGCVSVGNCPGMSTYFVGPGVVEAYFNGNDNRSTGANKSWPPGGGYIDPQCNMNFSTWSGTGITNVASSGGTATIQFNPFVPVHTFLTDHGGDQIVISGLTGGNVALNGTWRVLSYTPGSPSTITFAVAGTIGSNAVTAKLSTPQPACAVAYNIADAGFQQMNISNNTTAAQGAYSGTFLYVTETMPQISDVYYAGAFNSGATLSGGYMTGHSHELVLQAGPTATGVGPSYLGAGDVATIKCGTSQTGNPLDCANGTFGSVRNFSGDYIERLFVGGNNWSGYNAFDGIRIGPKSGSPNWSHCPIEIVGGYPGTVGQSPAVLGGAFGTIEVDGNSGGSYPAIVCLNNAVKTSFTNIRAEGWTNIGAGIAGSKIADTTTARFGTMLTIPTPIQTTSFPYITGDGPGAIQQGPHSLNADISDIGSYGSNKFDPSCRTAVFESGHLNIVKTGVSGSNGYTPWANGTLYKVGQTIFPDSGPGNGNDGPSNIAIGTTAGVATMGDTFTITGTTGFVGQVTSISGGANTGPITGVISITSGTGGTLGANQAATMLTCQSGACTNPTITVNLLGNLFEAQLQGTSGGSAPTWASYSNPGATTGVDGTTLFWRNMGYPTCRYPVSWNVKQTSHTPGTGPSTGIFVGPVGNTTDTIFEIFGSAGTLAMASASNTANGVALNASGVLNAIGTGGINATTCNGSACAGSTTIASINAANYCADSSGTPNAITCTTSGAYTSYSAGDVLTVKVANTTTATTTININADGVRTVHDTSGNALTSTNNLIAGGMYLFRYDGSYFQAIGPLGAGSGNVSNSGTPLIHQTPVWVDATHIAGVANGTTGQFWGANTGADPSWQTPSTGGSPCTGAAAGDICYYNGTTWVTLTGNASGTKNLQETSAGVPSWATGSGTSVAPIIHSTWPGTSTVNSYTTVANRIQALGFYSNATFTSSTLTLVVAQTDVTGGSDLYGWGIADGSSGEVLCTGGNGSSTPTILPANNTAIAVPCAVNFVAGNGYVFMYANGVASAQTGTVKGVSTTSDLVPFSSANLAGCTFSTGSGFTGTCTVTGFGTFGVPASGGLPLFVIK